MKRYLLSIILLLATAAVPQAWAATPADNVLGTLIKVNRYFMDRHPDPTLPTNVGKLRPSNLWTRGVYYEGLMALYGVHPDQAYINYTDRWATAHQWQPRNGVNTCDADDQCCEQTYLERYMQSGGDEKIRFVKQNLQHQMGTKVGWWTWVDAIQMAMPVYAMMYRITGDAQYMEHAMKMYRFSRDTLAGGLYNKVQHLWWRDADFVPPYKEADGANCYWSRGNGWVYAALVRCMSQLKPGSKYYKQLRADVVAMSKALLQCQRGDALWNVSLLSPATFGGKELSGSALFLYGMSWALNHGVIKGKAYRECCDRTWQALVRHCIHRDGFLGYVQGTGKQPADAQPVTYTRVPDFDDFGTGCLLLGGSEYYKLVK